jgi:hypothetical protein
LPEGEKMKNTNCYRIVIEDMNTESDDNPGTLQLEVQDREDIFAIVDTLKKGSGLDEQSATQVGIALRLLGPAMMQNREHPLFVDFMPHFKDFMVNMKKTMKNR